MEYLGQPKAIGGVFQAIGIGVKKYLLWNAVTADKGHRLEEYIPKYTLSLKILSAVGKENLTSKHWFGRDDNLRIVSARDKRRSLSCPF